MTHRHKWRSCIYGKKYSGAICTKCKETLSESEVEARLNATEILGAEDAKGSANTVMEMQAKVLDLELAMRYWREKTRKFMEYACILGGD